MRVAMYSTKPYESVAFRRANELSGHEIVELEDRLRLPTVPLADGAAGGVRVRERRAR